MERDGQDILWGLILALLGLSIAGYAALHYDFGTLQRMGPGFFPIILGAMLALLGLCITLPALTRAGTPKPYAWRQAAGVIGSVLVFGLTLDRLGVLVATVLTVLIATAVAPRGGIRWRLILTAAVTALTWVLFIEGLDMSVPVWPWSA